MGKHFVTLLNILFAVVFSVRQKCTTVPKEIINSNYCHTKCLDKIAANISKVGFGE